MPPPLQDTAQGTTLDAAQVEFMRAMFGAMVSVSRKKKISDQQLAEWLLCVTARWLCAHGVSRPNLHQWIEQQLNTSHLLPLVASAARANDFGGTR